MCRLANIVLMSGGDGPLFGAARTASVPVIRLAMLDNALSPVRAVRALRELIRALRETAPDLIHAHSAKAGALGRVAGWLLGIPVVYTVHGFAFKPAAPWRQRLAARVTEWMLAPLTRQLICVADAERELARVLPIAESRIHVIRNGIADTSARAEPGMPLRRIVMVARFAAPKRPDIVVEAFARANLPDCELVMAGDGPQLPAVRALAEKLAPGRVSFPGNVQEIAALLASAQAFVLVSDHEGFPLSVLEAMRAGLPIIASDLPGIRDQLDGGQCGILLDDRRPDALAEAFRALAADATHRTRLGHSARKQWEQHYGIEPMIKATWAIYQDALAGSQYSNTTARKRHAEN